VALDGVIPLHKTLAGQVLFDRCQAAREYANRMAAKNQLSRSATDWRRETRNRRTARTVQRPVESFLADATGPFEPGDLVFLQTALAGDTVHDLQILPATARNNHPRQALASSMNLAPSSAYKVKLASRSKQKR
jgi:hypothetical protein